MKYATMEKVAIANTISACSLNFCKHASYFMMALMNLHTTELFLVIFRFIHSVVFVIHMLAFVETPSSLTWSSDLRKHEERWQAPCGVLEAIELFCLAVLLTDQVIKVSTVCNALSNFLCYL